MLAFIAITSWTKVLRAGTHNFTAGEENVFLELVNECKSIIEHKTAAKIVVGPSAPPTYPLYHLSHSINQIDYAAAAPHTTVKQRFGRTVVANLQKFIVIPAISYPR